MSVRRGAVYGFLGPNGAGKTTTIRCLLGMLKLHRLRCHPPGQAASIPSAPAEMRRRIGYVPGEVWLYERETGHWHLDYVAGFRGGRGVLTDQLLERLAFDPTRRVKELSGNKQKLALILGMAHDPELLILDEPTSGLDPLHQEEVHRILEERVAAGRTVFLSSHVLSEVERVCERVGVVRSGRLVAEENVHDLLGKRLRHVAVTFAEPTPASFLAALPGVDGVTAHNEFTLTARAKGNVVDKVVKRMAERSVVDLTIQPAGLEEVFLEFYREEQA